MAENEVVRTERGWAGHFICADRCLFRRNTLLTYRDLEIVISSVGLMRDILSDERKFETIGYNRHYETAVFHADQNDKRYHDIDVSREVNFDSNGAIAEIDADDKANEMHEAVVAEIAGRLRKGNIK